MRRCALALAISSVLAAQTYLDNLSSEHPAIGYTEAVSDDAVARLDPKQLTFSDGQFGYLPSLLKALRIDPDSQMLVFSKTSFQANYISPKNPRAVYFNDEVSVGWVRGAPLIELAAIDPKLGAIFYTLKNSKQETPRFIREQSCLQCHQGPATLGVPGIFIGSVFPNQLGTPARLPSIITDYRTPFAERWGGWYVHAKSGHPPDRSNSIATNPAEPDQLEKRPIPIRPGQYLSATSDIVALMTFEHQTLVTNLLTRLHWELRIRPNTDLEPLICQTASALRFEGEASISKPIEGSSSFTKSFSGDDFHRKFDLTSRLFSNPLSHMINSRIFRTLPAQIRARIRQKIGPSDLTYTRE